MSQRYSHIMLLVFGLFIYSEMPLHAIASQNTYIPAKVVYDVSSSDPVALDNILDRISMLQNLYNNDAFDASIIVVIHEGAIPLFKVDATKDAKDLMSRARSLTMGEIIQFKICEASARLQKITQDQLYDFVSMVPMADAEIIKLQRQGYAYLR